MNVSTLGKNIRVPDDVYKAFAEAVYKTLDASKVSKYDTNPTKLTNQIYGQIQGGLKTGLTESVTVNGKRYQVDYNILAFSKAGAAWAEVSWGNNKATLTWTNGNTKEGYEALAEYGATLSQLNSDVWKEFVSYSLTGTNKGKKVLDYTENFIRAIGDKTYADKFVEDIGGEVADKVKAIFKNGFKEFIKNTMPNGESIVNAAELYQKTKKQLDSYESQITEYQNLDAAQQVYESYQQSYQLLTDVIRGL